MARGGQAPAAVLSCAALVGLLLRQNTALLGSARELSTAACAEGPAGSSGGLCRGRGGWVCSGTGGLGSLQLTEAKGVPCYIQLALLIPREVLVWCNGVKWTSRHLLVLEGFLVSRADVFPLLQPSAYVLEVFKKVKSR